MRMHAAKGAPPFAVSSLSHSWSSRCSSCGYSCRGSASSKSCCQQSGAPWRSNRRDVTWTSKFPDDALQIEKQLLAGKGNRTIRKVLDKHATEVVSCLYHVVEFVELELPHSVECFVGWVVVTNSPVIININADDEQLVAWQVLEEHAAINDGLRKLLRRKEAIVPSLPDAPSVLPIGHVAHNLVRTFR